jgi:Transposase
MTIVAGFDVHRAQITFDALIQETGEVHRGRIAATPEAVGRWVGRFPGERVHVAVEACTGWLFVCEALGEAGAVAHLAETTETRALRGKKRRAKTDRTDARWLRTLLAEGRLPEAWIPPAHVREWRTRTRLRRTLVDERTAWLVRVQATLFDHGIGGVPDQLLRTRGRAFLSELELPDAARERIEVALAMIDAPRPPARPARARHRRAGAPPSRLPRADAPLRHRAGDGDQHRRGARRRVAPVGVAQGGALRRPRRRGAPLRPVLAAGQADPAGDRRNCAGRCMRPPSRPASHEAPTTPTTSNSRRAGSPTPGPR